VVVLAVFKPWRSDSPEDTAGGEKTLVVLPFENLGSDEDEYFADGITDEITSRLAQIPELHVISRTSAIQYKNTEKSLREIGSELGVAYVLEGTIRWDKSTDTSLVRITPQLIKVDNDFHVWAENYEQAMTQIFAVQSNIATQIASALDIVLVGEPEQQRPTDNVDAYTYYLRGKEHLDRAWGSVGLPVETNALMAIGLFENAITLDSNFAEPFAEIGLAISGALWANGLGDKDLRVKAQDAIERALILAPELPIGHEAKGVYHNWVEQNYDLALKEFTRAKELGGDDGQVLVKIAVVQMRQGNWSDAEQNLIEAAAHDPRSIGVRATLSELYWVLHRFEEALRSNEQTLALGPEFSGAYSTRASILIGGRGDTAQAGQVVRDAVSRLNSVRPLSPYGDALVLHLWRYQFVDVTPAQVRASFPETLTRNELKNEIFGIAQVYRYGGQQDSAQVRYDSLITLLKEDTQRTPDDYHHTQNLGLVCMLAGYHDEAIRYARLGMEALPISSCHL
jgi:TolB-like protein